MHRGKETMVAKDWLCAFLKNPTVYSVTLNTSISDSSSVKRMENTYGEKSCYNVR